MAILIHGSSNGRGQLWQGGLGDLAYPERYDVIVLCADELQADDASVKAYGDRIRIISAPNDDSANPFTKAQATIAVQASKQVADEYKAGKRILVSCRQGRNRSGLVMALTLHRLFGISGEEAIRLIRSKVPHALANPEFNNFLATVKGRKA